MALCAAPSKIGASVGIGGAERNTVLPSGADRCYCVGSVLIAAAWYAPVVSGLHPLSVTSLDITSTSIRIRCGSEIEIYVAARGMWTRIDAPARTEIKVTPSHVRPTTAALD